MDVSFPSSTDAEGAAVADWMSSFSLSGMVGALLPLLGRIEYVWHMLVQWLVLWTLELTYYVLQRLEGSKSGMILAFRSDTLKLIMLMVAILSVLLPTFGRNG